MSVLPAFLLSRKQKSLDVFFKLLGIYASRPVSLEKLLYQFDTSDHFRSMTTLKKYFRDLASGIDAILCQLQGVVVRLQNDAPLIQISPHESGLRSKIDTLLKLIDALIKVLSQKKYIGVVLADEIPACFHSFLFFFTSLVFLKPP